MPDTNHRNYACWSCDADCGVSLLCTHCMDELIAEDEEYLSADARRRSEAKRVAQSLRDAGRYCPPAPCEDERGNLYHHDGSWTPAEMVIKLVR